jgi:DNA-3-methyladenine glycosylase I
MAEYHDREWGVPSHDDRHLFEMLILEGAQAGLSWATILNRREGYRRAFADFDPAKVAAMTDRRLERLLSDPGIIRNRLKVFGTRANARAFLKVQREFGSFATYLWDWVGGTTVVHRPRAPGDLGATPELSDRVSKDLKVAASPSSADDRLLAAPVGRPGRRSPRGLPAEARLTGPLLCVG